MSTKDFGNFGEDLASKFLRDKGYILIERNFRSIYGEIDIVAQDGDVLVFIEVKTRTDNQFGSALEAITPWKIKKIIRTAQYYKIIHPQLPEQLRIDAVTIDFCQSGGPKVELYKNITG